MLAWSGLVWSGPQCVYSKVIQHILYATLAHFLFARRPHDAISGFHAGAQNQILVNYIPGKSNMRHRQAGTRGQSMVYSDTEYLQLKTSAFLLNNASEIESEILRR